MANDVPVPSAHEDLVALTLEAIVDLAPGGDERAPGAAVTQALCGELAGAAPAWEHSGPCRWPHNTAVAARAGTTLTVRVVAVCPSADQAYVQRLVDQALAAGSLVGPTGHSEWMLLHAGPALPRPDERALAERLAATAP